MEIDNVFKIATKDSGVRRFLEGGGWTFEGEDKELGMDRYANAKTGKRLCIEDISDDFPVTLLIGELDLPEFSRMATSLAPEIPLLEVESSWEGERTSIVVAMTPEQVRTMFGRRTKMKRLDASPVLTRAP